MCADAAKRIQSIETVHFEAWHEAIHDPMFHEKCNFFDMRLACERGIKAPSCTMTAYSGAHYFEFIDDNTPFQNAYRAMLNKGDAQFGVRLSPHGEPVLQTFGAVLFHNYDLVDAMFIMPSYLLAGKPDEIPADIMKVFYAQAGDFYKIFFPLNVTQYHHLYSFFMPSFIEGNAFKIIKNFLTKCREKWCSFSL